MNGSQHICFTDSAGKALFSIPDNGLLCLFYGDVLMMDLDTLRQDIKRNILYPCGVNIERKDGSVATVSLKEWTGMELYEKDALKSWGFSYAPNQVTEWQYH